MVYSYEFSDDCCKEQPCIKIYHLHQNWTIKTKSLHIFYSLMSIQKKFSVSKGLRMKHVLMIGMQLIHRLKIFHSLGYVHGDIKPANIMFGRGKNKNTLYLIDFGISRHESEMPSEIPSDIFEKQNLQLNGTPLYASINLHLGWSKVFK